MSLSADDFDRRPAGFFTRSVAFVIDLVILVIVAAVTLWTANTLDAALEKFDAYIVDLGPLVLLAIPFIVTGYFLFFWSLAGRTPGKWTMGLRIVSTQTGERPSIGRSLIRYLAYFLSAIALWIGFLWVLIDKRRRGWHDILARTAVVYDRPTGR